MPFGIANSNANANANALYNTGSLPRAESSQTQRSAHANGNDVSPSYVPMISRKVKACSACRKHKIRCIMDNNTPPCRRCLEKGLGCVLNKSLQTLINERSQYVSVKFASTTIDAHGEVDALHFDLERSLTNLLTPGPPRL